MLFNFVLPNIERVEMSHAQIKHQLRQVVVLKKPRTFHCFRLEFKFHVSSLLKL